MKTIAEPVTLQTNETREFLEDVQAGLKANPRSLPCKYFYDERGSQLFDAICELPEYYVTRTERAIMRDCIDEIARACGERCLLVELGSGSSTKTRLLLDHLEDPAAYVPVDISEAHLLRTAERLQRDYPAIEILPLCADFHEPLELPTPRQSPERTMIYFPGSTIGNFDPCAASAFLRRLRGSLGRGDGLILGIDLHKSSDILEPAYNDAAGVTAAFNINLLHRINRELDGDFPIKAFRHHAIYRQDYHRIEMHLICQRDVTVHLGGEIFAFRAGESIVTEFSYKYRVRDVKELAAQSGFRLEQTWTDAQQNFGIFHLSL